MKSRERILSVLKGTKTDHVPMWLRDEFNLNPVYEPYTSPESYRTIGSGLEYDEYTDSWIVEDDNVKAVKSHYAEVGGDLILECKIPGNTYNRFLVTPPSLIVRESQSISGGSKTERYAIPTPEGKLFFTVKYQRNVSTQWITEDLIKTREDLHKIMSVPFSIEELDFSFYHAEKERLGDKGLTLIQMDTPLVTISGMMNFQEFLLLTIEDRGLLRDLCEIAYERIDQILDHCFDNGMGPIFRLNGSEQATPPMSSPELYKEFIHFYEKKLIKKIHDHDCFAAVHCHGHIKEVLPMMIDASVDLLDPVEAPPNGNIGFYEALATVGNKTTLSGNIQFEDLENKSSDEIIDQVKTLLHESRGHRFILNTTASPITFMSDKLRDNYLAMIDTWAERRAE